MEIRMRKHSELTKTERASRVHYFKQFRAKGQTALEAWNGALRHMAFRAELSASVAAHAKRSKAAKKAWKARKSQMAFA
jgi:hypothetical protein